MMEKRQKLTKCSPCNTGKMSHRESGETENTVKWVTLFQKNYKFSGGLLKLENGRLFHVKIFSGSWRYESRT